MYAGESVSHIINTSTRRQMYVCTYKRVHAYVCNIFSKSQESYQKFKKKNAQLNTIFQNCSSHMLVYKCINALTHTYMYSLIILTARLRSSSSIYELCRFFFAFLHSTSFMHSKVICLFLALLLYSPLVLNVKCSLLSWHYFDTFSSCLLSAFFAKFECCIAEKKEQGCAYTQKQTSSRICC